MKDLELENNLNQEQLEIVKETEGYIRVIAGAGTGKTRALTYRFAYLINQLGVDPSEILCLTFTNKAAYEMARRVKKILDVNINFQNISTIHSFCARFLKNNITSLRMTKDFNIIAEDDYKILLRKFRKEVSKNAVRELTISKLIYLISNFKKNKMDFYITYIVSKDNIEWETKNDEELIIKKLLDYQRKTHYFTYDDLILFTYFILKTNKKIAEQTAQMYSYIMVDEFQDTNKIQIPILKILSSYYNNLFVVGDPDQCIYSFNGSDISSIVNMGQEFSNLKTFTMIQNYRSSKEILDVANALIKNNSLRYKKDLISIKGSNSNDVTFYSCKDIDEENKIVIKLINTFVNPKLKNYNDVAILYRSNKLSLKLEPILVKFNIPYYVVKGTSFFERIEIKTILSFLRLGYNFNDDIAFQYILKTIKYGIGKVRLEILEKYSIDNNISLFEALTSLSSTKQFSSKVINELINLIRKISKNIFDNTKISDILSLIYKESTLEQKLRDENDEDRISNVQALINTVIEQEKDNSESVSSVSNYLDSVALITDFYNEDNNEKIKLITSHSAKGLEFKNVIVYEFNDKLYPSVHATTKEAQEEERRLAFVTFTRAKETLSLLYSKHYDPASNQITNASIYLSEIYDYVKCIPPIPRPLVFKDSLTNGINLFNKGDIVISKLLGKGKVIQSNNVDSFCLVKFDNLDKPRRINTSALILVSKGQVKETSVEDFDPYYGLKEYNLDEE